MKIVEVKIENWRAIRHLELTFEAPVTVVHGPNETGKSSVQEAIRHAFLVEASSTASELNELVPWGSEAKAHVEVTFTTRDGQRLRVVKSFPKGEGRLYTGLKGDSLLAEGRSVQKKLFEHLGIPSEAVDLFSLLWVGQGTALELFAKKRDGGPLTGAAQTLVKSIIKENLLSDRAEELLRELKKEREEILLKNNRPRKGSRLGDLEQRAEELAREAATLDVAIEETERQAADLEHVDGDISRKSDEREREAALLALLERKHEAARELEPKLAAYEGLEQSHARLLALEAKEKRASEELPAMVAEKLAVLDEWVASLDERRERAQQLEASLEEVAAKLKAIPVSDRALLDELEETDRRIAEARVRLEASKLTVRVTPPEGRAVRLEVTRDQQGSEEARLERPQEWSAARTVRLALEEGPEIECYGPLSREDWEALTAEISELAARLAGRLEELGCGTITEAKEAFDAHGALERERSRLAGEIASLLGAEGTGLERETAEAKAAREEADREIELLQGLGVATAEGPKVRGGSPAATASASERLRRLSSRISVSLRDIEESRSEREALLGGRQRDELTRELFTLKEEIAHTRTRIAAMEPESVAEVSAAELKERRRLLESLAGELAELKQRRTALAALMSRSEGSLERSEELDRQLGHVRAELTEERRRVDGIELLIRLMEEEKEELDRNIVVPLEERLTEAFRSVSGERYRSVGLDDDLGVGRVGAPAMQGEVSVDVRSLSHGTREQLSFLFRLLVAQYLSAKEPQVMMLDDTFVNSDEARRERLFEMMISGRREMQFILFTCHGEHYERYRRREGVALIDMGAGRS